MFLARRVVFIYLVLIAAAVPVLKAFLPSFSTRLAAPRAKLTFQSTGWKKAATNLRKNLLHSTEELTEFNDDFFGAIEPKEIRTNVVKDAAPHKRKVSKPMAPSLNFNPSKPLFTTKNFGNGDTYEGEWLDGKKHGFGTYRYGKLNATLEGTFVKGLICNGTGTLLIFNNQFIYEGTFVNGLLEGLGKHISKEGFIYEGMFVAGKKCGMGRQVYPGMGVYEGEWKNNIKHGQGRLTNIGGQVMQGEWRDDEMYTVEGERAWKDGTIFKGTMVKGVWQGPGVLINSENITYAGTYLNGQLNGAGTVLFPDGRLYDAEFTDGMLSKALVEVTK